MIAFAAPATNAATIQRQLSALESLIHQAGQRHHAELSKLQGQRDKLLLRLTDVEGAHDRRFVPVR